MGPSQVGRLELHSVWGWKHWVLSRPLRSSLAQWRVGKTSLPKTKPSAASLTLRKCGPISPHSGHAPRPPTATLILLLGSACHFSKILTLIPFPAGSWFSINLSPVQRQHLPGHPPHSPITTSGSPRGAASRGIPCCPHSGPTSQWECQTLLPFCWFSSLVSCEFLEG